MLVASELKLLFTKINFSGVRLMRFDSKDYSALPDVGGQEGVKRFNLFSALR